jgi:hypothetical protein
MIDWFHCFGAAVRQHIMQKCVAKQSHSPYGQEAKERERDQDSTVVPLRLMFPMTQRPPTKPHLLKVLSNSTQKLLLLKSTDSLLGFSS